MSSSKTSNFLEMFKQVIKRHERGVEFKDIEDAIDNMLARSNIKNFNEYIRFYILKNKKRCNIDLYENVKYLAYQYTHSGDLVGHYDAIERISFDHSAKYFFSAGSDGLIKCWDKNTGFLINCLIGHRGSINDMCFSKDGRIMVSCDLYGIINMWCLDTFCLLFNIQESAGIVFSEFFLCDDFYNLVVILNNGIVKFYKFTTTEVVNCKENDFTVEEAYKAICITDGGRFLLRAGYWAYLIIIDTHNPDKCLVFETNDMLVKTICAEKDCLRFAAGCNDQIILWTFFCEGSSINGNFNKIAKNTQGYWKKTVIQVDMNDNCTIENICFLKNHYLVCVCSDMKIRIYSDLVLRHTIDIDEIGNLCPHPYENIFAICGQTLKFFYLDKLISSTKVNFLITDYQFSNDGNAFIIGDEMGNISVYQIEDSMYKIKEQFFLTDFGRLNETTDELHVVADRSVTVDRNRRVNAEWSLVPYVITKIDNRRNALLEKHGIKHFTTRFIDKQTYKRKFCASEMDTPTISAENISSSCSEVSILSESSSSSDTIVNDVTESTSSEEEMVVRRRHSYRISPRHSPVTLRRNARQETPIGAIRLRRYNTDISGPTEMTQSRANRRRRQNRRVRVEGESRMTTRVRLRRHQNT